MTSAVVLPETTLTWVDRPLHDGDRAVAQVSAHGRPAPCVVARTDDGLVVQFDVPQRPVAPGQTVALYDVVDPDAVVGAGIAA
jgi:tRNA U34 2-thiouridine synthase MnmA/TrmU